MAISNVKAVSAGTKATTGLNVAVMVIVAVAITIVMNYLAAQSRFQIYSDWSSAGDNTLSTKSTGLLDGLPAKLGKDDSGRERAIEMISFLRPNPYSEADAKAVQMIHQLVDVYKSKSRGRIVFTKFDVNTELAQVASKLQELKIKEPAEALLIAYGDRVRTIYLEDMVRIERPRGGMMGMREEGERIAENKIEETITSNLLAVLEASKPKAYFLTGHGESDIDSSERDGLSRFADNLRQVGYDVAALDLTDKGGVPADANVVIWIAATRPVASREMSLLKKYAHQGGRMIVAMDRVIEPGADASMLELLGEYAVKVLPGVVCEPIPNPVTGGLVVGMPECTEAVIVRNQDFSSAHPVTRSFYEQRLKIPFPTTRAFERILEGDSKAMVEDLGRSGKNSWVDAPPYDFANDKDSEPLGPRTVLAAATLPNDQDSTTSQPSEVTDKKSKEGRLIAIGSATLAHNVGFQFGRDLYLSAVEWLAGREFAAGIGPKAMTRSSLADVGQVLPKIVGITLILSGLACAAAGWVWTSRRGGIIALLAGVCIGAFPFLTGIYNLVLAQSAGQ